MEETLQHSQTTQRFGLPTSNSRIYYRDGSKVDHAVTLKLKLDESVVAGQDPVGAVFALSCCVLLFTLAISGVRMAKVGW